MSNPTWNWLVILAPWSRLIFPVCSFLTCRRSVKRRWGAFNTDSPRSCLLDKIRRHLCDNTLPFQNCLEFGLTGIPVHKRVKKPRFEIFESESYVKNIFTNYVVIKQKMISVSQFWKSPRLWASSGSNIQRLITLLSVFFRSNIANLYPRSTTKYWLSLTVHIYFEQSTKKYWLALTVRIFFVWNDARLLSFLKRYFFFIRKKLLYLQWKKKTDDIFQGRIIQWVNSYWRKNVWLLKMVGLHAYQISSLKELQKWMRIFNKLHTMLFAAKYVGENYFQTLESENNSMIRNYSQYGMSLSSESVCLSWIKKYGW